MKGIRKKLKKSLAAFLAFCMTMTSISLDVWASEIGSLGSNDAVFMVSGEDLRDSAQAAIEGGNAFHFEDLEVAEGTTADQYEKLFTTGSVYEFSPAMDVESELSDVELRMFVQVKTDKTGYRLTGDEKIMLLFVNLSEEKANFRLEVDGKVEAKASVKANSFEANAVPPAGGTGTTVPEETTEAVQTTTEASKPSESTAASTESTEETQETQETQETEATESTEAIETSEAKDKIEETETGEVEDKTEATEAEQETKATEDKTEAPKDEAQAPAEDKSESTDTSTDKGNAEDKSDSGSSDSGNSDSGSSDVSTSIIRKYAPKVATTLEAEETTEAVKETTEAVKETTEAVKETTEAVKETTEAVKETTEAVKETTEATNETTESVTETTVAEETTEADKETVAESSEAVESTETETTEAQEVEEDVATGGYGLVKVYNDCNAKLYVTTLKDLGVEILASEGEYTLHVIHRLGDQGGFYVKEENIVLQAEDFNEEGIYDLNNLEFQREGIEFVKASADVAIANAVSGVLPAVTIDYRVADGYRIVAESAKARSIFKGELTEDKPVIQPGNALVEIKYIYQSGLTAKPTESHEAYDLNGVITFEPVTIEEILGYTAAIETEGTDTDGGFTLVNGVLSATLTEAKTYRVVVEYRAGVQNYTVEHLFQNQEGTDYAVDESLTETLSGNIGDLTKAEGKTVQGFQAQDPITQKEITAEGATVQIKYDRNEYILNFNTNGGSYVDFMFGKYGQTLTIGADKTSKKSGYTLEGWYTDNAFAEGSKVDGDFVLEDDTTLYANWIPDEVGFTVVYLIQDANKPEEYSMLNYDTTWKGKTGEEVSFIGNTENEDKVRKFFIAQNLEPNAFTFKESIGEKLKADGTSVITVKYDRKEYTLTFGVGGAYSRNYVKFKQKSDGQEVNSISIKARYQQDISALWIETLEAYQIMEAVYEVKKGLYQWEGGWWSYQQTLGNPATETSKAWVEYIISLRGYDAVEAVGGAVVDQDINLINERWYVGPGAGGLEVFRHEQGTMGYGDSVITYAVPVGEISREIIYYRETLGEDGDITRGDKQYKLFKHFMYRGYQDAPKILDVDKKNQNGGFILGYTNALGLDSSGQAIHEWPWPDGVETGLYLADEPTKFYYDLGSFTLSLNLGVGENKDSRHQYTSSLEQALKEPTEKPHPNATFQGWYIDPNFTTKNINTTMPQKNLLLYAKWSYPSHTLVLGDSLDEGKVYQSFAVGFNEKAPTDEFPEPLRDGFVFTGWYSDKGTTQRFDYEAQILDNKKIYAGWQAVSTVPYTIQYVTIGGEEVAAPEIGRGKAGSTINAKAIVPEGDFASYMADVPGKTITLSTDIAANVIRFEYTPVSTLKYMVLYKYNGVIIYKTKMAETSSRSFRYYPKEFDNSIAELAGYEPAVAYVQAEITGPQGTRISYPIVPKKYTITYQGLEGAYFADGKENKTEYTSITDSFYLVNPSREGYEFTGWESNQVAGGNTYNKMAVHIEKGSQGNLTFKATWKIKAAELTVKYQYAAGQTGTEALPPDVKQTVTIGQPYSVTTPVIEGYLPDRVVVTGTPVSAAPINVTVTYRKIQVQDATVTYDDQPHTINPGQITGVTGADLKYSASPDGPWTDTPPTFTNANPVNTVYVQVTKDGYVTVVTGNVNIGKKKVTLTAATVVKEYDGIEATAIPEAGSDLDKANQAQLISGHWFVVTGFEGQATDVTTADVVTRFTDVSFFKGTQEQPEDVSGNYELTPGTGYIRITNSTAGLDFTLNKIDKTYDGEASVIEVTPGNSSIEGVTYTYRIDGAEVEASALTFINATSGTVTVTVTANKANYAPVTKTTTVNIARRSIQALSGSRSWITTADSNEVSHPEATAKDAEENYLGILTGDRITVTDSTKINTNAVTSVKNVVKSFTISNGNGDVTNNYTVTWEYGDLKVTKDTQQLTVDPGSLTATFNGRNHRIKPSITNDLPGELVYSETKDGTYSSMSVYESQRNVTSETGYTVWVKAISPIYTDSEPVQSTLIIKPMTVHLVTGGGDWTYDGQPHGNSNWKFETPDKQAARIPDQPVIVTLDDVTVTNVSDGQKDNTVREYYIGNDKNDILNQNYVIKVIPGKLGIIPGQNPVTLENSTVVYDGAGKSLTASALPGTTFEYSTDGGKTWSGEVPEFTDADTYTVMVKAARENYADSEATATLTIRKRPIGIQADPATKPYDMTPLTGDKWSIVSIADAGNEQGPAANQMVTSVTMTGSRTQIGGENLKENVPSQAVIKAGDKDVSKNYEVTYLPNDLIVTANNYSLTVNYRFAEGTGTVALPDQTIITGLNHGEYREVATPDLTAGGYIADIGMAKATVTQNTTITVTYYKPTVEGITAIYDGENHFIPNGNVGQYPAGSQIHFAPTPDAENWSPVSPNLTEANRDKNNVPVNNTPDTVYVQVTKDGQTVIVPVTVAIQQRPITVTAYSTPEGGVPFTPGIHLTAIPATISGDGLAANQILSVTDWSGESANVTDAEVTKIEAVTIKKDQTETTRNYDITFVDGLIQITAATGLGVNLEADGKVYDGTPVEISAEVTGKPDGVSTGTTYHYSVSAGADDNYQSVDGIPQLTEAGTYSIKVVAKTSNYVDATATKTVTIEKRPVTIKVVNVNEVYTDAITFPFRSDKIEVEEATADNNRGLLTGHAVTGHTTTGEVSSAADMNQTIDNRLNTSYDIQVTEGGRSVLANYAPNPEDGTIQITTGTKLQVVAEGYTVTYNGEEHTLTPAIDKQLPGEIKFVESEADKNDDTKYRPFSEFKAKLDAGTYPVYLKAFSDTYTDSDVLAVTITIEKREFTLKSASDKAVYSGSPLTNRNYTTTPENPMGKDDELSVSITGTVTDVTGPEGVENTISSYKVMRGDRDVTEINYRIKTQPGRLVITKAAGTGNQVTVKDNEGTYNGDSWTIDTPTASAEGSTIWYSKDGGTTWSTEKPSFVEANESGHQILVKATNDNYEDTEPVEVKVIINRRPITVLAYSATKTYVPGIHLTAVTELALAEGSLAKNDHQLKNPTWTGEARSVTGADDVVTDITAIQVMSGEKDLSSNYEIQFRSGKIVITASENIAPVSMTGYTRTYDAKSSPIEAAGGIEGETSFTYYVKKDGGTETEAEGIPQFTEAGTYTVRVEAETPNYITREATATVTIKKRPLTITAKSLTKKYDDGIVFPVVVNEAVWDEETTDAGLLEVHKIENVQTGGKVERTDIDKEITSEIISYTLTDQTGTDVKSNYDITEKAGKLNITTGEKLQVNLGTEPKTVIYDGSEHRVTASIEGQMEGTIKFVTNAADRDNEESYQDFTALTGLDAGTYTVYLKAFSDVYEDSAVVEATLTINRRPVQITSDSARRAYSGEALTADTYRITGGTELAPTDTADVKITGSVTDVTGEAGVANTIEAIQIFHTYGDGEQKDVAALNYEVQPVEGRLVVYQAAGAGNLISVEDVTGVYDGNEWTIKDPTASAEGSTIWYSKDGGTTWSTEKPSFVEANESGHQILVKATNDNYEDTEPVEVKVIINRRPITVTANSNRKKYDTTPLTDNGYSMSETGKGKGLVTGHKLSAQVSGSVTEVSEVPNVVENVAITAGNVRTGAIEDVTRNYAIETVNGTLTIEDNRNLLNITYQYHEGEEGDVTALPAKYSESLRFKTAYSVPTKAITGYVANWPVVEGTMMDQEVAVTVIYHKDENGNGKPDCDEEKHSITFLAGTRGTLEGTTVFENILSGTPFNKAVSVPQTKANSGYRFSGWKDTTDSSKSLPEGETPIIGSKVYEAQWTRTGGGGTGGGNDGGNGGGTNTPDNGVGPGYPTTDTLLPGEVPLANLPVSPTNGSTTLFIDDGEVPLSNLPKTGDKAAAKAQLGMLFSGLLMGLYVAMKKKDVRK